MTVLTDTQIVTASGGLVELGYGTNVTDATITAGTNSVLIGPITVVCDGSPVLIDVFYPRVDAPTNGEAYATVELDGVSQGRAISANSPASLSFGAEHHGQIRLTPSAGSHTFQLRGYANTASGVFRGASASGFPAAFLRVSKIVQATQWPAVTTGTIICTSSTRPASPFAGQIIYETDSGRSYIYNGTAWVAPQVQTNPPICRAYATGTQSLANATVTAITLGSESYDTDTMHSTVSNTSRITFTTAGVYSLFGEATFDINATGARDIYLLLNGATRISEATAPSSGASTYSQLQVGAQYSFAAGDYVEMYAWQNSGGSLNLRGDVTNGVWLAASFVGKSS